MEILLGGCLTAGAIWGSILDEMGAKWALNFAIVQTSYQVLLLYTEYQGL